MRDVVFLADRAIIMGGGRKIFDRPIAGLTPDDLGHFIMSGAVD
jgi:simple sugar transport system ATP-binding protein